MAGARADTRAQTTPPPAGLRQLSFYDYHTARTGPTDYSRFPHLGKLSLCSNEGYGRNAVSTHNLPASLTALRLAYSCPRNTFIYNNSNVFDSNREENGTVFLRLSHLLKHRGPDQRNCYQAPDGRAFIGFERLMIVDPTETGR